jgi:uncharacterized protein YndB with AHSA1/START domain
MNTTDMITEGDDAIVISRTFNAPPRIVFEAWTQADFVKRWWAPKALGAQMVSCDADVREGGSYRYVLQSGDQAPFAFSGKYVEVSAPSRLVYTQAFEPMADAGYATITVTFEPVGANQTRMVSREAYPTPEVREMVLATGMEKGMRITMDQLDELVGELQAAGQ